MTSSRLKNKFNKNSSAENWEKYFNNLNIKKVFDNKIFWTSGKLFFSSKGSNSDNIWSAIRQKGESQNECYKKTRHIKFYEKRKFLTP